MAALAIATVPLALGTALLPAVVLSGYFFWRYRRYLSLELVAEALSLGVIAALLAAGFGIAGTALATQIACVELVDRI